MSNQTININPKLEEEHNKEFQLFCKKLNKQLHEKNGAEKEEILIKSKEEMLKKFSGSNFHSNADLAVMESLMLDLLQQDMSLIVEPEKIVLKYNNDDGASIKQAEKKAKTRRIHLLERNRQLMENSVSEFIRGMEKRRLTHTGWKSIFSLMRDGSELKKVLIQANQITDEENRVAYLNTIIKPYIQFVEADIRCEYTGLLLSDIWRYFRHTWINEYKSLPGRAMSILIRDAATPNHPVIGIAALGSSVAQQTCRDKWIGWNGEIFIEKLKNETSSKYGKWIIETLELLLKEIYLKDFLQENIITKKGINNPSIEKVKALRELSLKFRKEHIENPDTAKFTVDNSKLTWEERAQTNLFKSKRAVLLSELLYIKMVFNKYSFKKGTKKEVEECLQKADFKEAVQRLIRKAKANHVGINIMDIIVCGSIAPYNYLLGGKLVCMMLTSPEVSQYYNQKYANAISLIASSMNGKSVIRKPQLTVLGTTSLYTVGSSQYNRIKIPAEEIGGFKGKKIEYKKLGYSEGYGLFHFSSDTFVFADRLVGRTNKKRVNSIFGEGANPLMRKLKDALELLKLESNSILNHRSPRVVYGVSLAENFGDVLIGIADKPKYIIPQSKPSDKTKLLGRYWIKRWLQKRIMQNEILEQVGSHTLSYPITHGARVPLVSEEVTP